MTNPISHCFKNTEKKPVTFITGGDPNFEMSKIIKILIKNKVDIIEIGMPFLIPWDGPTIQLSSKRAIDQNIKLNDIFNLSREAKIKSDLPIILMGYYNLILHFV